MGFVLHTSWRNASVESVLPLDDLQSSEGMYILYLAELLLRQMACHIHRLLHARHMSRNAWPSGVVQGYLVAESGCIMACKHFFLLHL